MVYGWVGGKHACVDLTDVSPLVGLGVMVFTVGQAALKVMSSKVSKHEKACSDNQHLFIPFVFDIFVFLAPEVVDLQQRVQRAMHNNVMSLWSMDVVFTRISFGVMLNGTRASTHEVARLAKLQAIYFIIRLIAILLVLLCSYI